MQDREKNTTPREGRAPRNTGHLPPRPFPLKDSGPLKFRSFDKKLYFRIEDDLNAKFAFAKMTSGAKALDPSCLLLWLGVEAYTGGDEGNSETTDRKYADKSEEKQAWKKRNDAVSGLERNARTLRRVSKRLKGYLTDACNDLPGEIHYSMTHSRGQEYMALFRCIPQIGRELSGVAEALVHASSAIKAYAEICKVWPQVAPKSDEKEIQRTIMLLRAIKRETGRCRFEHMAPLISVGRKLNGRNAETAESLRSIWRAETKRPKHTILLQRHVN